MRRALLCCALLALPVDEPVKAATLTAPVASYAIDVRLDPATRTLDARQELVWRNPSSEPVYELIFHLYLNAFRDSRSTFLREAPALADTLQRADGWASTEVTTLRLAGIDGDLADRLAYVQPDDGNPHDRTLATLKLPQPVAPGAEVRMQLAFRARLPFAVRRTGYWNDFYFVAQWFPKLAVYEPRGVRGRRVGGWNAHQFHALTEFYADFGDYDVTITVPRRFHVGATGQLVAEIANTDDTVSYRYTQDAIHDFAWTADPSFTRSERRFIAAHEVTTAEITRYARLFNLAPADIRLRDVEVRVLGRREHRGLEDRIFRAAFKGLKHYGLRYGAYPYNVLTVVVPPRGAKDSVGGMEFPTLITIENHGLNPEDSGDPEMLTIHEFGHQYWYGLVATNEVEEAWLDEGFATYSTAKILDEEYGRSQHYSWIAGWPVRASRRTLTSGMSLLDVLLVLISRFAGHLDTAATSLAGAKRGYLEAPAVDPVIVGSWRYRDRDSYFVSNYWKASLVLEMLEREVGSPTFDRAMRRYALDWRFRHPSSDDYIRTIEAACGRPLRWLTDPLLTGTSVLDYSVTRISREVVETRTSDRRPPYRHLVEVRRRGELRLPVSVRVTLSDGTTQERRWDGSTNWAVLPFSSDREIAAAEIDPDNRLVVDVDRGNNRLMPRRDRRTAWKAAARYVGWLEQMLLTLSALV